MDAEGKSTPRGRAVAALLVALVAGLFLFRALTLRQGHNWGDDFAQYILHARNLAEGRPYTETGYLYNPRFTSMGPRAYPPGVPMLLVPVYKAFGLNLQAMKLMIVALAALLVAVYFFVWEGELSPVTRLALAAVLGLSPVFVEYTNNVISDVPFTFVLGVVLLVLHRPAPAPRPLRSEWPRALLAGLLIYFAVSTRTIGIVLLPAVLFYDLVAFRRPTAFGLVACAAAVVLYLVQYRWLAVGGDYLDQLADYPSALAFNLRNYPLELRELWASPLGRPVRDAVWAATLLLAAAGYLWRVRSRFTFLESFAVGYLAVVLLWPSYQSLRLLFPLIPLYLFYIAVGLTRLAARVPRLSFRTAGLCSLGAVIVIYGARYAAEDFGPVPDGIHAPDAQALFRFVREQTPPEAVLVFQKPRALALFAGRRAAANHDAPSDDLRAWMCSLGVTHVVDGPGVWGEWEGPEPVALHRMIAERPAWFERMYAGGRFFVYRFVGCGG